MSNKYNAYRNKFISEHYDRINVTFTKGKKELYRSLAAASGMSLNALINLLLELHLTEMQEAGEFKMQTADQTADIQTAENQTADTEKVPIEKLNLSVRAYNALKRANVQFVSEIKYVDVRNVGLKNMLEVQQAIEEFEEGEKNANY